MGSDEDEDEDIEDIETKQSVNEGWDSIEDEKLREKMKNKRRRSTSTESRSKRSKKSRQTNLITGDEDSIVIPEDFENLWNCELIKTINSFEFSNKESKTLKEAEFKKDAQLYYMLRVLEQLFQSL